MIADILFSMLQRSREWLTIGLLSLLPLHALLVTFGTKLFLGSDHAPMFALAVWKEVVLGLILLLVCIEIVHALRHPEHRSFDLLDATIVGFIIVALVRSFLLKIPSHEILLGTRYDLIGPLALLVLRRVHWSAMSWHVISNLLISIGFILGLYGLLTLILPTEFFMSLGYSSLHSLYDPSASLAAFQYIESGGIARLQSTFSGPNQFGIWLIIPLILFLAQKCTSDNISKFSWKEILVCIVLLLSSILTFSRSAWIGLFCAVIIILLSAQALSFKMCRMLAIGGILLATIFVFVMTSIVPGTFLRSHSTQGHFDRPIQAIRTMIAHPYGLGLGSAGPASNAMSDVCVNLQPNDDPVWAQAHPNLCVFLGSKQVQPKDRACKCPLLTENWFLQIGVETGVLGLLLYFGIIGLSLYALIEHRKISYRAVPVLAIFSGILISGVFLHAFEDAAVNSTLWILLAIAIGHRHTHSQSV